MKKLLYINLDFFKYQNKARAQVKAFCQLGNEVFVATINNKRNNCYFEVYGYQGSGFESIVSKKISKSYIVEQGNNSIYSLWNRLIKTRKINKLFKKEIIQYVQQNNFDYCYIRRIGFFVIFLKSMFKKISEQTKILYEIPTYPLDTYDNLLINFSQKLEMLYFNIFIKKYIILIPIILQNDTKLDKKMVPISNGIDFNSFQNLSQKKPKFQDSINMLIVAHVLPWHGYDRLIKSIAEYRGKIEISVDIFGDSNSEIKKLQQLVEDLGLRKSIHFKGEEKLENILKHIEKYHIAVGYNFYYKKQR